MDGPQQSISNIALSSEASSRRLLPSIDVALLHGQVQQQIHLHDGTASRSVAKQQTAKFTDYRPLQASTAAGQLPRKQRSPSPPHFRAGFSYERAQTPDLASRAREQQRLAQHKAFKAAQPCHKTRAGAATAVLNADQAAVLTSTGLDKGPASSPALPVLGAVPGITSAGNSGDGMKAASYLSSQHASAALQSQQPQQLQSCAGGNVFSDNGASASLQAISQHSTANSSSNGATVPADAAASPRCTPQHSPSNISTSMQPLTMSLNLQPQQQQASMGGGVTTTCKAAGTVACTTSSDGGGQVTARSANSKQHHRRSSAGGMLSTPGRPAEPHPIVGSQSLLHAMAAGYSQYALHSLVAESLGLHSVDQAMGADPTGAAAAMQSTGSGASSFRPMRPNSNAALTVKLPNGSRNSSRRQHRTPGDAATAAAGSRPATGSGMSYSSSGRRRYGATRESDEMSEDLPCLDTPAPQSGFKLHQVAAALGDSIHQLRQQEMQQLQQQQGRQAPAAQTTPAQVTKQGSKGSAVQLPTLQQQKQQGQVTSKERPGRTAKDPARDAAAAAAEPAAQSGKKTTRGAKPGDTSTGSSSSGKGSATTATSGQKTNTTNGDDATAESAAGVKTRKAAAGKPGKAPGKAAAAAATPTETPAQDGPQSTEVTLQERALAASAGMVASHTKSQLLLAQAFGAANSQQPQQPGQQPTNVAPAAAAGAISASWAQSTVGKAAGATAPAINIAPSATLLKTGLLGSASATTAAPVTQPAAGVDPMIAMFGGRKSPARDRVLRASWDKQQMWEQQQQKLQTGWRAAAAAAAGGAVSSKSTAAGQQRQQLRHSMTPEPYLYSHRMDEGWQEGSSGSNGSSGRSGLQALPPQDAPGPQTATGVGVEGRQGAGRMPLQQLACSITQSVSMQASLAAAGWQLNMTAAGHAAAAADHGEGDACEPAASTTVKGSSTLGLIGGEVERLIGRYQQQSLEATGGMLPASFNLDHALSSCQQIQALAAALPQLPELRMLLLRNNGLKDPDLQILAASLLNPSCCGICGLDLGFNQLGPEAPLLLLPLLHKPPLTMQQARRRSTAEAAEECEGSTGSTKPSYSGVKNPVSVSGSGGGGSSSGGGGSSSGRCGSSRSGLQLDQSQWSLRQSTRRNTMQLSVLSQPSLPGVGHAMLQQLVLCSNAIGDAGAEALCRMVGTGDCPLQLLHLSGCGITERLSGCLKGMLEGARQLKVLRLGWNMLGPKGAKALAEGLKFCSSGLEQLYLPWSGITDTGASHIAKALESNTTVKLLDLSGCQVSAGTCVVLAETLSSNTIIDAVILEDNPLGAFGVQKLLKAVHEGHVRHVDIAGCSFLAAPTRQLAGTNSSSSSSGSGKKASASAKPGKGKKGKQAKTGAAASSKPKPAASTKAPSRATTGRSGKAGSGATAAAAGAVKQIGGNAGSAAAAFSAREPDGCYTLDLALPSDRQVAVELLKLTEAHGLDAWVSPTLNKKPYSITGVTKQSLPTQGTLAVTFVAKHKVSWDAQPLDDPAFHSMWTQQVQPKATPSRPSLLLQQQQPQLLLNPAMAQMSQQGLSWGGTQGLDAAWGGNGMKVHAVSDGWKLELLQVLLQDCYFTSAQAGQIVAAFSYGEDKVEAAVKVFGRVVDPENFADQAYLTMNAWQVELADSRIGCLRLFSPDNPTGTYSLLLAHGAQRLVAVRLLELFCEQHINGLCAYPHSVCFTSASLDGQALPAETLQDPVPLRLPKSGIFKVSFVDLRPVPVTAKAVSPDGFAVLLVMLSGAEKLDGWELADVVDAADLEAKVSVVGRFNTWSTTHGPFSGKVGALQRLRPEGQSVRIQDLEGFIEAIHICAIHHYLTGAQLLELVKLLPASATEQRVQLCSKFWARLTDRAKTWSDVMRALTTEQQVMLSHRLGMANVFDPVRPTMHYRLRMWRADEHQIAWRLHRMALNATHEAFVGFAVDGKPKKIAQTANLWALMRGSAADNDTPTVTLDFDFVWQDNLLPQWAAVTIQSAWRAYMTRKAAPPVLRLRLESMHGRAHHVLGVRGSMAGSKSGLRQDTQPLTYRSSEALTRRSAAGVTGSSPGDRAGFLLGFQGSAVGSSAGLSTRDGTRGGGPQPEWDPRSSMAGAAAVSLRGSNL